MRRRLPTSCGEQAWAYRRGRRVVEIPAKVGVDAVDRGLKILLGGLVERNGSESRAMATKGLENRLVVSYHLSAIAGGSNGGVGTSGERPLVTSTPIEPLPTPVRRVFLSLKAVRKAAISRRVSR